MIQLFHSNYIYLYYRKTAIAIDAIINQKRFNEGNDDSEYI